jgi:hypothetical protein
VLQDDHVLDWRLHLESFPGCAYPIDSLQSHSAMQQD